MAYISQIKLGPTTYDISAYKLKNARTINLTGAITGSANFDGTTDISINTTLTGSHTHDQYLPLTAGQDKKLTGPLGLTENINYGPDLPSTNTFNGQLFFLEDSGAALPTGGSTGQALVKNSATDGDASWKDSSISWIAGTSSGPQPKIFEVTGDAIPAASDSASGVVTTSAQTFAGDKTFNDTTTHIGKVIIHGTTASQPLIVRGISGSDGNGAVGDLYLNYNGEGKVQVGSGGLYGAVWNDYAEFRNQFEEIEPGYCVASADNGKIYKTTEKFQACDGIVSDTAGFYIGQTDECQTPLAVAGRVLAYFYGNREDYHAGDTVCAGPEGKVMKMSRKEIREWPDRIVGIVSEIPDYKTWGTGNVEVNNRIWIKVK